MAWSWRAWKNVDPLQRFKEIERLMIEPLVTAAVGLREMSDHFFDWQNEPNVTLDEESVIEKKNKIAAAVDLVIRFAHHGQAIQIAHKVR